MHVAQREEVHGDVVSYHYAGVFKHVLTQIEAQRPGGHPVRRREVYNEIYERMMAHARYELERELQIAFRTHERRADQYVDYVEMVAQHDDLFLIPASPTHVRHPCDNPDLYMFEFQLHSRMHLNGPHRYTNGMGVRWIPGKHLRHQTHSVTARRALIRALQTYRLPSERDLRYWPFTDPRR